MPKKKGKKPTEKGVKTEETAADTEGKYGRRTIESNWGRYEEEKTECEAEERSSDFSSLTLNSSYDCNYFQFKSEKNWENEAVDINFSGHKLFNLDLDVLANGLACVPFYERMGLDKAVFSESDILKCDKKAKESALRYESIRERLVQKMKAESELFRSGSDTPEVVVCEERKSPDASLPAAVPGKKRLQQGQHVGKVKSVGGEDLEDWLDSILDD